MASPIIQLADMPATPLARAMWRFGWPGAEDQLHVIMSSQGAPTGARTEAVKHPGHITACIDTVTARPSPASRMALSDRAETTTDPMAARARADTACYELKDPVTGRVWGTPSAFGRVQCLDCPEKAAPPSARREARQVRRAKAFHEPMPAEALQQVRMAFDRLLERPDRAQKLGMSGCEWLRERKDTAERLRVLVVALQEGRISQPIQAHLLGIARATNAMDLWEAERLCSELCAKHWHWLKRNKWLQGLSRLFPRGPQPF